MNIDVSPSPRPLLSRRIRLGFVAIQAIWLLVAAPLFAQSNAGPASDSIADQWDALLKKHARPGAVDGVKLNLLDYAALRDDSAWPELTSALASAAEPDDPGAAMAFWINAYNILAVKAVLGAYPVKSINDAGPDKTGGGELNVWKAPAGKAAGAMRNLDDIEHKILRPMDDPRIHAAIVCASVSCPDLRLEAYRAEKLDQQLDDQLRTFLANPDRGSRLAEDGATIHLSTIFQWFGEDFTKGGKTLLGYLKPYLPEKTAAAIDESMKIEFFPYDWRLNDAANDDK